MSYVYPGIPRYTLDKDCTTVHDLDDLVMATNSQVLGTAPTHLHLASHSSCRRPHSGASLARHRLRCGDVPQRVQRISLDSRCLSGVGTAVWSRAAQAAAALLPALVS